MRRHFLPLLLILALIGVACGTSSPVVVGNEGGDPEPTSTTVPSEPASDSVQDRLVAAQQRWTDSSQTDYVLKWSPVCFCPQVTFTDTIVDGELVSHEADGETFFETTGKTMEDLHSEIQLALDDKPFRLEAEFDADTGAVISYWVDVQQNMADEEYGVIVRSVTPTEQPKTEQPEPEQPEPELPGTYIPTAADFTVDHGCGFGFAAGSHDQTVGFVLSYQGEWTEEGPAPAESIDLATTSDWKAEVRIGADLFANWCDDAIEEDEPTPRVDVRFPVTGGSFTFDVDGQKATGVITGLVALASDDSGEVIEIAELELYNQWWGVFAG